MPAASRRAQERCPEPLVIAVADVWTEDFSATV